MRLAPAITILILLVLLLTGLTACGAAAPTPTKAVITLTDDAGRTVQIVEEPQRIISLAPSNTELLFALGLGSRVVGVSDYTTYPPEATQLPSVGGMPLNHEKIVSLAPDLILAAGITTQEDLAKLEELEQPVLVLNPTDIEGILSNFLLAGKATGTKGKAGEIVAQMREEWEAILEKTKEVEERPRVFVELDETLYTVAPGSFIDPLITMAGGVNIAADVKDNPYPQFSAEEVIKRDPQIIVLADAAYGVTPESLKARPGWSVITAVKNEAIYPIDPDPISRPGPRVIEGLRSLAKIVHPELFQ